MLLRKKEEIEAWLNKYAIQNYELIEDQEYGYVVNVNKSIDLSFNNLKNIEVKFNKIDSHFDCSNNELELLEGCPNIINGFFDCSKNKLKTLEGGPKIIKGSIYCLYNKLTSLKGCPKVTNIFFDCSFNELKTLEGCPEIINNDFYCNENQLIIEGLKYLPEKTDNCFIDISNNEKLRELQSIHDFYELKEKVLIILEKESLLNRINKENLNINKCSNKI